MDIKEQIINLISPDKEKYAIELVDEILSLIHQEIEKAIPKEWKKTRKTMLPSYQNGELGFHTGSGLDHTKLTIGTLEEYGNSHYNECISDIRQALKDKGLL